MHSQNRILTIFAFFLVIALPFCHAWAQPFGLMNAQKQAAAQEKILSSQNGRYVFGQISDSEKDQFMLDTQTGRLWRVTERGDIGKYLLSVPYCNSKGEYSPYPDKPPGETASVKNPGSK